MGAFQSAKIQVQEPTLKQQQYIEDIYKDADMKEKIVRLDKRFDGVHLDRFDLELKGKRFQQAFPGSNKITKDSASPTVVYKTKIGDKEFYVKSFELPSSVPTQEKSSKDNDKGALLYEKEVYGYIRYKAIRDPEVRKHFIQMLFSAVDRKNKLGHIFTQDTGGVPLYLLMSGKAPLEKYFQDNKHAITARFVSNIFTQLLHVVSLMERIGVVHNDMHFGNVLVVKDNVPNKDYTIYGQEFRVRDHPYSLVVYDFDMASIVAGVQNPFRQGTCREYGRCKGFQSTDKYVWLVHLLGSPDMWVFTDDLEKDNYRDIVATFKQNLMTEPSGGFWESLFGLKRTPQKRAIKQIQNKYNLYMRYVYVDKEGTTRSRYAPPIFHASCEYSMLRDSCERSYSPLNGNVLAQAWHTAVRTRPQKQKQKQQQTPQKQKQIQQKKQQLSAA